MRRFKGLLWAATLLIAIVVLGGCASQCGAPGAGFGSSGGPRGGGPAGGARHAPTGPSVDEIIQELALTEERTPEVRGVLEASADERSEIMARHAGARGPGAFEEVREELEDLRARTETMLAPLLTDEQMARYRQIIDRAEAEREQMVEDMKTRGPGGRGRGMGRRPGP
jgi:hypothetical protein